MSLYAHEKSMCLKKNQNKMKISVIIPTFNRACLVKEALESVLGQKVAVDEIIIVDDGSNDETVQVLQKYKDEIRILRQENKGVSATRNRGIAEAKYEWLAFLDSDDLWHANKIMRQKQVLLDQPGYKICYTDEEWRKNGKWKNQKIIHQKYSGWIYPHCLPRCIISPSSVLVHRSVFQTVGFFDESLPACEDYDLWLRVACRFKVLYLEEKLIVKRAGHWIQLSENHSLDKYRIIALQKMLDSGILKNGDENETLNMLRQKYRIYSRGCRKHNKPKEAEWAEAIYTEYSVKFQL